MHYLTAILIYCSLLLAFEPRQPVESGLEAAQKPASAARANPAHAPGATEPAPQAALEEQDGRTAPAQPGEEGRGGRIRTSDLDSPVRAR